MVTDTSTWWQSASTVLTKQCALVVVVVVVVGVSISVDRSCLASGNDAMLPVKNV